MLILEMTAAREARNKTAARLCNRRIIELYTASGCSWKSFLDVDTCCYNKRYVFLRKQWFLS